MLKPFAPPTFLGDLNSSTLNLPDSRQVLNKGSFGHFFLDFVVSLLCKGVYIIHCDTLCSMGVCVVLQGSNGRILCSIGPHRNSYLKKNSELFEERLVSKSKVRAWVREVMWDSWRGTQPMAKSSAEVGAPNPAGDLPTDRYDQDVWSGSIYVCLAFGACTSLCLDLLVSSTECGAGVDKSQSGFMTSFLHLENESTLFLEELLRPYHHYQDFIAFYKELLY